MTEEEKMRKLDELIGLEVNAKNETERKKIANEYAKVLKTTKLWKEYHDGE